MARFLVKEVLARTAFLNAETIREDVESILRNCWRQYVAEYEGNDWRTSACCLTMAILWNDAYHIWWMGDAPALLTRIEGKQSQTTILTTPHRDRNGALVRTFSGVIEPVPDYVSGVFLPSDMITVATDGFVAVWDPESLGSALSDWRKSGLDPAKNLLNMPFRDDATFVSIRRLS